MSKQEFLLSLQKRLSKHMPRAEVKERLGFYSEMIDDLIEEGYDEYSAVSKIGSVDDIVSQILAEYGQDYSESSQDNAKAEGKVSRTVFLILGFPLWFPLTVAAFVVALALIISFFAVIFSLIISMWAIFISFAAGGLGGTLYSFYLIFSGNSLTGLAFFGGSLLCAGLAIFTFYGCMAVTKKAALFAVRLFCKIKDMPRAKRSAK